MGKRKHPTAKYQCIEIDSFEGRWIDNFQCDEPLTNRDQQAFESLREKFKNNPHVKFLTSPNPGYNCHGLTFGSRRSLIDGKYVTIQGILSDDGFSEINISDVRSGDIVLYLDNSLEYTHSGVVCWIDPGDKFVLPAIWILSKWGGTGPEVLHLVNHVPNQYGTPKYFRSAQWPKKKKTHDQIFIGK